LNRAQPGDHKSDQTDRIERLRRLKERGEVDVLIIGAGINGAGLFRDLCEQGVSCLIIDKSDYGSGTSAAPSRLIHGGLKYLETGEFGLVAQSTLERNLLLRNAPHYVKPLPTLIPIFSWTRGCWAAIRTLFGATAAARSRGALLIKIGLMIYDFYGSRHRVMPRHRLFGKQRSLGETPELTPNVVATGLYYDAAISHPERLVFELIVDGLKAEASSAAANYVRLTGAAGGVVTLALNDGAGTIAVRPKIIANAAGPWIDAVNARIGAPSSLIGGTKGSHILLDNDELVRLLKDRMIYFEADDGRICLVYPYLGRALVGSTDIPASDPDTVICTQEEIDYLLESLRALLPTVKVDRGQIVFAYSGIRPLPASDVVMPGLISRDHSAPIAEPDASRPYPVISLVGGKWTTFRGFAEEVADMILARLGRERRQGTQALPIGGGHDFPNDVGARAGWLADAGSSTGLGRNRLELLLDRYGTAAITVARHIKQCPADKPVPGLPGYSFGEIDYILRYENVETLADLVLRRTTLGITGAIGEESLAALANYAGKILGWPAKRVAAETSTLMARINETRGVRTAPHNSALTMKPASTSSAADVT
jgi:glycerol-3-phosphate dehydrogenase